MLYQTMNSMDAREATVPRDGAATPEQILGEPGLTKNEKADLLTQMAYDAAEQSVASEEGMPGGDDDLQRRVRLALAQLGLGIDAEHTSPAKQHGSDLIRIS
jgi:hypothetical protein